MHLRTVLSGALTALLLSGVAVSPSQAGQSDGGLFHLPSFNLPGVFGGSAERQQPAPSQPTQMAQSDAGGSIAIEDQIRQLNGKIEELNFQILQMQDQMRKQQEDNEFRFQQLEGGSAQGKPEKKSDASDGATQRNVAVAPAADSQAGDQAPAQGSDATSAQAAQQSSDQIGDVIVDSGNGDPGQVTKGAPPKDFGTITVDKNGNVVTAKQDDAAVRSEPVQPAGKSGADGTVVASLPPADSADELYRNSYQFILSGDYGTAEKGFRDRIARFPKDAKAPDAHYWLGEALLGQQKYHDAAEVFLAASKDYPRAKKAPDMLLKLGVSLVGLKQNDVACATFAEVGKRYPEASSALKQRVKEEESKASC